MAETIDWPPRRPLRRRGLIFFIVVLAVLLLGGGTALSYYVDALWFESLGYAAVFWKTLNIQAAIFIGFAAATFGFVYGAYLALRPAQLVDFAGGTILINGQPVRLPVEPALRLIALGVSLAIGVAAGAGMTAEWPTIVLYWYGGASGPLASAADPIFGRPLAFYLFTLPAWELL